MISPLESFISTSSKLFCSPTVTAFDSSLNQCIKSFKDLLLEYEQELIELENIKGELSKQKASCESKCCSGAKAYQKELMNKENIIQVVASITTKLYETRNVSYVRDIYKAIYGETTTLIPPTEDIKTSNEPPPLEPSNNTHIKNIPYNTKSTPTKSIKKENLTPLKEMSTPKRPNGSLNKLMTTPKKEKITPEKEQSSLEDISFKDSSSEIDVTPRAKSPILSNGKKGKNSSSVTGLLTSSSSDSPDGREKKKCSDIWPVSQAKKDKIVFPKITTSIKGKNKGRKLVQKRFIKDCFFRQPSVVDLTNSPDCSMADKPANPLIKKESSNNEETILPSPTSNPTSAFSMSKTLTNKESQTKFKRPLSLKHKSDVDSKVETKGHPTDFKVHAADAKVHPVESKVHEVESKAQAIESIFHPKVENSPVVSFARSKAKTDEANNLENSINILNPKRFKSPKKSIPEPELEPIEPMDCDVTHCDTLVSICDLPVEDNKENTSLDNTPSLILGYISPTKSPLSENKNIANVPAPTLQADCTNEPAPTLQADMTVPAPTQADCSMSLLDRHLQDKAVDWRQTGKKKSPESVEPVYKEPTVRKKAEKMALPAWLCDECTAFISNLYDDPDPTKISAIVSACSKHRGRRNPARPKTPPGFWDPRWNVPTNTEEFNRMNDAA